MPRPTHYHKMSKVWTLQKCQLYTYSYLFKLTKIMRTEDTFSPCN